MAQGQVSSASVSSEIASVDDFYFSALFDETQTNIFPISDSKYAEELQFQEALYSSSTTPQTTITNPSFPSSSSSSSFLLSSLLPPAITVQVLKPIAFNAEDEYEEEIGESSQICCEICTERKPRDEIFPNERCTHSFCSDCITTYVANKVEEERSAAIACPGLDCKGVHDLEIEALRSILPKKVVERWDEALCEALIMISEKFYCPFKDCSAVFVRESEDEAVVIRESECPICHRLFCARCYVPWHSGIECEEYERLNEDERGREDLMVREMAMEKKWKRCPRCKYYVERVDGCLHISCRCKYEFCYGCGSQWTQTHGACQRN